MGAAIIGWGTALPEGRLTNAELAERYGVSEDLIFQRTGIRTRRVAENGETSSSLAGAAGAEAIKRANLSPEDIDMVILATCTPDHQIPAAAPLVQDALGASRAGSYDVNAVCAGFIYGLAQASGLIESGAAKRVLLCGADVFTSVTDYSDRGSAMLFGDGAGAVVIERSEAQNLGPFVMGSDGSTARLLWIPPGKERVQMKGRDVYVHALDFMAQSIQAVLVKAGLGIDEVDLLVGHQASARILRALAERVSMSEDKVVLGMEHVGNTSAASIPLALADVADEGRLKDGDVVLLTACGGGLVWASAILRWGAGNE